MSPGAPLALVTGAGGFLGRHVCRALIRGGFGVRAAVRDAATTSLPEGVEVRGLGEFGAHTRWDSSLDGVAVVIHLAARAHVLSERSPDPMEAFRRANVEATAALAEAASKAGVRRFVFVSTARVQGGESPGRPFTEADPPAPPEPYERSKLEAERALARISADSGIGVVTLRPPLVYGPGVKANFLRLMQAVDRGWPLPLASIRNRRSLIGVTSLANAIAACARHPAAAGRTFLVADGEDLSTPELVRRMARALGRAHRMFPVPVPVLKLAGRMTGRRAAIGRLCGSLQVDDSAIRTSLGWRPSVTLDEELMRTANWLRTGEGA